MHSKGYGADVYRGYHMYRISCVGAWKLVLELYLGGLVLTNFIKELVQGTGLGV